MGSVSSFAAEGDMVVFPAVPNGYGCDVRVGPDCMDLADFLALAAKIAGGIVYVQEHPFQPDLDLDGPLDTAPEHLLARRGQVAQVSVAFCVNGLPHFWEQRTAWYIEWQEFSAAAVDDPVDDFDDLALEPPRADDPARAQARRELVDTLMAMPEFRAAKGATRQRVARIAAPDGTDQWSSWDAIRAACEQADQEAARVHAGLTDRLDELAEALITTASWRLVTSPAARRQAAEQFLVTNGEGWAPSAVLRDELYARAKLLVRATRI
jgi:hypothetical protein